VSLWTQIPFGWSLSKIGAELLRASLRRFTWLILSAIDRRAPVNGVKVTMKRRRFRAATTPERTLPGSCKA
jgi:hypothetical protein